MSQIKSRRMTVLKSLPLSIYMLLALSVLLSSCGDEESGTKTGKSANQKFAHIYQEQEPFHDWVRERYQNIVIIHPPQHPHADKIEDFARIFSSLARQACVFLRIEPQDSIVVYFYTGIGHGLSVTKKQAPFSDGNVVHFWFPSFYGAPIAKHLLPIWHKVETKHQFLKHGIIALLDGAGRNYHQETLKLIDSGKFIPLNQLAVDTTIDVDLERLQSAEAASFVDYLVYANDIDRLKELYASEDDFAVAVEKILRLPAAQLEKNWLAFVKTVAARNSSTNK